MIVSEMHKEFKITLDKVDSQAYPEFLAAEIDFYLNEAQDRFVKTRYGRNNIYVAGFEEIQKRTDDLKALVVSRYCETEDVEEYLDLGENVVRAKLDSLFKDIEQTIEATEEYMLYVKSIAQACKGGCCNWASTKLVQQDDLFAIVKDPFNKPKAEKPVIFFEDNDIFVWAGKEHTIKNFFLSFIKKPIRINVGSYGGTLTNCELSDHTHKEIVQMAVKIALENIESPRQQTQELGNVQKVE